MSSRCFYRSFKLFELYLLLWLINDFSSCIEVTISQGTLSGLSMFENGNEFHAFYSIPYAKPPLGELRFQPPLEPDEWNGVRNCTEYPPACIQKNFFSSDETDIFGQEDCLYLNVFTRKSNGKSPVLVYIHGGAFSFGTIFSYGANYLMNQRVDIVLVTINYRLGILGFLSSTDESLPGNYGMKDQVMALKWIKKNIASFGGDPDNVLISGHSAGAGSVHLHMFSPLSKGLFNKAVSLSGTAISSWALHSSHTMQNYFRTVCLLSGCSYSSTSDAVRCLKQIPAVDLMEIQIKLFVWNIDPSCIFGPTVEPDTVSEPFLNKNPRKGEELDPNIPWITGVTSAEAIFKVNDYLKPNGQALLKYLNDHHRRLLPIVAIHRLNQFTVSSNFAEDLKKIYFHDRDIELETVDSLVELISDVYFTFGAIESVSNYKGRAYLYFFDYKSVKQRPFDKRLANLGVSHGEELQFLFDEHPKQKKDGLEIGLDDRKLSENLVKILVNFAYTGCPEISLKENFEWIPIDDGLLLYLNISNDGFRLESHFFMEKRKIWSNISKYFDE